MAQMHVVIELWREAVCDREDHAVNPVQHGRVKERIMDEVVTRRVDAPRDRNRVDQRERNPHDPWDRMKAEKQHGDEYEMAQAHQGRDQIPGCVGEEWLALGHVTRCKQKDTFCLKICCIALSMAQA